MIPVEIPRTGFDSR